MISDWTHVGHFSALEAEPGPIRNNEPEFCGKFFTRNNSMHTMHFIATNNSMHTMLVFGHRPGAAPWSSARIFYRHGSFSTTKNLTLGRTLNLLPLSWGKTRIFIS